ncbi:MAG: CDP-diacylglycerol--glycerol-3-phosphate 3-phosphatidyltransferase [Chlamydiae bacterium]|nr:CDP-diacylglycerol--glycerol-3-phosphate 3-phosphatidyltransferase [Chlamydiota bacterium]
MSIALYLTLGRILLGPIFLFIYLYHNQMGIALQLLPFILIGTMAIAELSDVFDGLIARRRNQVTELGKILDPMADSIFRLSVFLTLTQGFVQLPLWLVLFFFYRDSIISTLRTICALRGVSLAARLSGKVKAVVQASATFLILTLMIPYAFGFLELEFFQTISRYIVLAAVAYSLFSGIEYLLANHSYIKKALTN